MPFRDRCTTVSALSVPYWKSQRDIYKRSLKATRICSMLKC